MKTNKNYKVAFWLVNIVLLGINISALFFFFRSKQTSTLDYAPPKEKPNLGHAIYNALNLNDEQIEKFSEFNGEYHQGFHSISVKLDSAHIAILTELKSNSPNDSIIYLKTIEYGQLSAQLKQLTVNQFKNIKSLLSSDQKKQINSIYQEIIDSTLKQLSE